MTYRGKVQGGVVVLESGSLPEGTQVSVVPLLSVSNTKDGAPSAIWAKLAELGQWSESQPTNLPSDLAANHDHYLHGLPKRR
jgi:hypothetical protein